MPRLKALCLLGFALLLTLLKAAFGRRRGLRAFTENYAADGLPRMSAHERELLTAFSGCIACGLCERGAAPAQNAAAGTPMALVLAGSRSTPDFATAARSSEHLDDARLMRAERLCPVGVPIVAIASFVRGKSGQARLSIPPGSLKS